MASLFIEGQNVGKYRELESHLHFVFKANTNIMCKKGCVHLKIIFLLRSFFAITLKQTLNE